jgi:Zn-dependent protease
VKWSYRIANVRGIDLKVHVTFALIVIAAVVTWGPLGWSGIAFGVALMALLFGCVTLHEFGHAVAAQRFGIPVREIVLLPIGGVALLGRNPRNALQELVIAAAGPLVNVLIVGALIPVLALLGEPITWSGAHLGPRPGIELTVHEALRWLVGVNVSLVLFNLIPAFPLDGGRILRGLLGLGMDWTQATRWATRVGQVLAVAMGVFGFMTGQLTLAIIALLVFSAAGATHAEERGREVLAFARAGDACNRHAITLGERDHTNKVARYLLTSYQPDFAVMRGGELLGVVLRRDVLGRLAHGKGGLPVTDAMTRCPRVSATATLADVRSILDEQDAFVVAVFDGDRYLGLISRDDLHEAELILRSSLIAEARRSTVTPVPVRGEF